MKKLRFIRIIAIFLTITSCAIIKNNEQQSKFMRVIWGGYSLKTHKQLEESYGLSLEFKNKPESAKYIIADFEIPNNSGIYERKVFSLKDKQKNIFINSDPIYGVKYGFYYIKVYLAEDEYGEKILDSLTQSVKLRIGVVKKRDYAKQYTLLSGKDNVRRVLVIYPNNRKKSLLTINIPPEFKIGHATVTSEASITEYVPKNETVYNWSKIITLFENKYVDSDNFNIPALYAAALGSGLYKKFSKTDKEIKVFYTAIKKDGTLINSNSSDFSKTALDAKQITLYLDYKDNERKNYPNQREFIVARMIRSDASVWEVQCTVRYDTRWSKQKIESVKDEAKNVVGSFEEAKEDLSKEMKKLARNDNLKLEIQRMDDRILNELFLASKKGK